MAGSSSIELIDQKSASVTHIAVKLVCLTKFTTEVNFTVTYCNLSLYFALPL